MRTGVTVQIVRRSQAGISREERPLSIDRAVSSDNEQSYLYLPGVMPPGTSGMQHGSTRSRPKSHY